MCVLIHKPLRGRAVLAASVCIPPKHTLSVAAMYVYPSSDVNLECACSVVCTLTAHAADESQKRPMETERRLAVGPIASAGINCQASPTA